MGISSILAELDRLKRLGMSRGRDMVTNTGDYLTQMTDNMRNMQMGREAVAAGGGLGYRDIPKEEQTRRMTEGALDTFGGGGMGTIRKAIQKRPLTEFEQRHLIAQKNAALPVEQGGLGLPPNNTAMDRARAMGFDTPAYHGTNADVKVFDLSHSGSASGAEQYGSGVYTASNPATASGYVNPTKEGGNVLPLLLNIKSPLTPELEQQLTKKQVKDLISKAPDLEDSLWNYGDIGSYGKNRVLNDAVDQVHGFQHEKLLETLHPISNDFYGSNNQAFNDAAASVLKKDGVQVGFDNGDKFYVAWNPNQVRSRFAAFDPMRRHEADMLGFANPSLLGSIAAGGGGAMAYDAMQSGESEDLLTRLGRLLKERNVGQ